MLKIFVRLAVVDETDSNEAYELPELTERPLVTFALFAYNQEKYIREAVEGAFAQTYEPLEIILSDDCSTDRTFEIMQEMTAGYKGPHKIKLNRNNENMGISQHVFKILTESSGDYIVNAAGDDISLPERVSEVLSCFNNKKSSLVSSGVFIIDGDGNHIGEKKSTPDKPLGCSFAISRDLVDLFQLPINGMHTEDALLISRAQILNGVDCCNKCLLKYRVHTENSSLWLNFDSAPTQAKLARILRGQESSLSMLLQRVIDCARLGYQVDDELVRSLRSGVVRLNITEAIINTGFFWGGLIVISSAKNEYFKSVLSLFLLRWFPTVRDIARTVFFKKK